MLSSRIRRLRTSRGWTQKDLADRIKVSPQVVSNWEREYTTADAHDITNMAETFGCSVDYLTGRVDDPNIVLTESERQMYDSVGQMSFEELKKFFEFEEAEEEDIKDIIKQIEMVKLRRKHIKSEA